METANIIGGPALRRAGPDEVCIWLVLDHRATQIDALIRREPTAPILSLCVSSSRLPAVCGDHLFVYLLRLQPKNGRFPQDRKLYYDLVVDGKHLTDFGLTRGRRALVYPGEALPSFLLPLQHRNLLQGSCRKPHAEHDGKGQFDQLRSADQLVGKHHEDVHQRPSLLILTGDQIYADDVATPLLAGLIGAARKLTGWKEILPASGNRTICPADLLLRGRDDLLHAGDTGFSSGAKDNHLLSFGEYMAMYLAVWGGLKLDIPDFEEVADRIAKVEVGGHGNGRAYKRREIGKRGYARETEIVEKFLANAWQARRVMANTPTLMIFDDHEVTDDWNLNAHNANRLAQHPMSRRVQANALAAYWACQGWGNDPAAFPAAKRRIWTNFLRSKQVQGGRAFEESLHKHSAWDCVLPSNPPVIVLDTRTRRNFRGASAALIDDAGLDKLASQLQKLTRHGPLESLVLVSAAPVYGFTAVELVQLGFPKSLASKVDRENWIGNTHAFQRLQRVLGQAPVNSYLVFSGDVHYAFNRMELVRGVATGNTRILQFTSSALANHPSGSMRLALKVLQKMERMRVFNRLSSHYLRPREDRRHFINGHVNLGLLQLNRGQAHTYRLLCRQPGNNRAYRWTFDLAQPKLVHFSEADDNG